ncbi:MAG TPA: glycoside hydrolase family 2 protein, partial [Candidatus Methylacidiphilales bacterium]
LWCGNNELEGPFAGQKDYPWDVYGLLFDQLLPRICAELDPDTAYWPSSPHSPIGDRNESGSDLSGDTHHWSVFFGRQSFESQRMWRTRFMSEFGFQSYPELRTVESFTAPEDRFLMSRIMDYHQRSEVGNQTILSYLTDWFQPSLDFADLLILSQITQSLCVRYATEHLRRIQPLCGGVLYWQINDIWPCASWSSIDSFGRWKALQYDARRFFAPVLVSIEEDLLTSRARIHVSNQRPTGALLDIRWQITDTDGKVLLEETASVKVPSQSGTYVADLDAAPLLKTYQAHDLMIWACAVEKGTVLSRNWAPLARTKHLSLAEPNFKAEVEVTPEGARVHLSCEKPMPYVVLSLKGEDAWFDDNFFHLHPGEDRTINVTRGPAPEVIREQLVVRSLADWMPFRPGADALTPKPATYELQRKR